MASLCSGFDFILFKNHLLFSLWHPGVLWLDRLPWEGIFDDPKVRIGLSSLGAHVHRQSIGAGTTSAFYGKGFFHLSEGERWRHAWSWSFDRVFVGGTVLQSERGVFLLKPNVRCSTLWYCICKRFKTNCCVAEVPAVVRNATCTFHRGT